MEKLRNLAKSTPISFESWFISFVGIVLVRILFEQFSSFLPHRFPLTDLPTIVHYFTFYLAAITAFVAVLFVGSKTPLKEVSVICLFGFLIIWIPPIIDLAASGVGGHSMSYLFISGTELVTRFLTFFGGHASLGITLGIQIELALAIVFTFFYVKTATNNTLRAVFSAVSLYIIIFVLVATPSIIALFFQTGTSPDISIYRSLVSSHILENNINPEFGASTTGLIDIGFNKLMTGVNLIIALFFAGVLFFKSSKEKFMATVKNSRPERIANFLLLTLFGLVLSRVPIFSNWIDTFSYILILVAYASAWMFAVCENDVYDEDIDAVSNPDRPFVSKMISREETSVIGKIFLVITCIAAYAAGHYTLFFITLFTFVYHIYSAPPLRLKRVPILSSFLISLACLSAILTGFFLMAPPVITAFPFSLALYILLFFTVITNVRDIKDLEGDGKAGIRTLPVLLGKKQTIYAVAIIGSIFYISIPFYFRISFLLIPSIIFSILSWRFLLSKKYKEWKVFAVYLCYLILIIVSLMLNLQ